LLDDNGLFRASLGRWLASEPDLEVAGECGTSAQALDILKGTAVDVVLLDFDLGTEHGNDFISAARKAGYQGRFLIVAGSANVRNSAIALNLGASGIFLKSETPARLVQAIRLVGSGGVWLDQKIIQVLAVQLISRYPALEDPSPGAPLEERERNVLLGILEGLSNRKIGENMGLSESSVKNVVQHLFARTGVRTRSQLVRIALEGSLVATGEAPKRQSHEIPNGHAG
jgi:DNA-binding NarL/FixJ family response regulator